MGKIGTMNIGYVQIEPILGDQSRTIEAIARLSTEFGTADLLVLPELCNSGYNFESAEQARSTSETIENSPFVAYLEGLCRQHKLYIVAGINERDGDRLYNSAVLLGPGGYIGKYRKMHLYLNEKDFFTPGDCGLPVFDLGRCKVGILICFDWLFPEIWRILGLKGADLVCHPSNLVTPLRATRAALVHAQCNGMFVITTNRIGAERDFTFGGQSAIASPKGETLLEASATAEEVGIVSVDPLLARDKMITPRNHVLGDRRPQEYTDLIRGPGKNVAKD